MHHVYLSGKEDKAEQKNAFFPFSEKEAKKNGIEQRFSYNEQTEFPRRLRQLRDSKGETLAVAAEAIGVTRSTLGLYEKGENVPDVKVIVRIAQHYGATINYLLGEDSRPTFDDEFIATNTGLNAYSIKCLRSIIEENSPFQRDRIILESINLIIGSKFGLEFLAELFGYVRGDFQTVTLYDEFNRNDINDSNYGGFESAKIVFIDDPGFRLEVFETNEYGDHVYDGKEFISLIRNSKMARMQEMIIKMRDEWDELMRSLNG